MSEYLLINIFIVVIPLLLSFESKIRFYKKLPSVAVSVLLVSTTYIIWDAIAAIRGDWAFNGAYLLGISIFNLPLEEILFFITVPYACLFIYETGKLYIKDKELYYNPYIYYTVSAVFLILAFLNWEQHYTSTVFMFCAAFFFGANVFLAPLLKSRLYWLFMLFCFLPFFAVNYILTSLPIVTYSPFAIWEIRITTIPIEDFFYSFSMLSFYLLVYLATKDLWLTRKKQ